MEDAEALSARLRANPADHEAYLALKTLYFHQGDYGSLANLIAGWAGWVQDDRAASRAYVEVADLMARQLGDGAQAESYYAEALRRDPLSVAASEGLQALWDTLGEHGKLVEFLQQRLQVLAEHGAPAPEIALSRYRLGELWAKQLGGPAEALHHFRKAFELDPTLLSALYEARQLCVSAGDLRAAAELCEREAAAEPNTERKIALLMELSALHRDQLGDLDGAVSALERAHALVPEDAGLAYDLALLLIGRAQHADERTALGDRTRAADLLTAIAGTLDRDQAVSYLESALAYAPQHEHALSALERLLEDGPDRLRLPAHWVAYLASASAGKNTHRRRVKLARAYADQGQLEDAIYCLDPAARAGHAGAAALLDELRARARPTRAAASTKPPPPLPRSKPAAAQAPERARAARDRARRSPVQPAAYEAPVASNAASHDTTDLDDVNTQVGRLDVIDSLREATAAKPISTYGDTDAGQRGALNLLETTARQARASAQQAADDVDDFDADLDLSAEPGPEAARPEPAGGPERARSATELRELRRDAAALAREQRGEEAADLYHEILRADALDREAFAFLDSFYRRRQQHAARAQLLEHSAGHAQLPLRVRITRLREAASTYEARIKDYAAAIRCFSLLSELDTETDDAQRALKRLLERTERWDDLAQLIEAEIAHAPQADAKLPLLRRLATLHRERRNDRGAAADALERMLMLKPDDRALREALIEDLLALERYEDAVPWLERKLEDAQTKPQKLAVLAQLADLCRDLLRDADRAFAVYERMLALSPSDLSTLERMADLDEAHGNHARLLTTLERHAQQLPAGQAADVFARMAQIADQQLNDSDRASVLLSRAVDAAPERPEHLEALSALYEREERFADLIELLRERAIVERSAKAKIELHRRIALVLRDRVGDVQGAYEAWERLLALGEDREALLALQQRALERDDPGSLVELLGRLSAIEPDVHERRDLLFDRARLLHARLGRPAEAIPDLLRILTEIDPEFELAFDELAQASSAAGDHAAFAHVLEQRLQRAQGRERVEYAQKLADVCERELHDPERAIAALSHWAGAAAEDAEPHRRLSPLLTRARRYGELLRSLDALARLEDDLAARQRAAIGAADLAHKRLSDADGAWQRLVPLVEAGVPEAIKAVIALSQSTSRWAALYDLLENAGQIDRLLALLRERASREHDSAVRATLLRRTAQVLIEYAQDEDGAAEAYRALLELEEDVDALRFMQSLALRRDDPETLANALARLAALETDPEERRDLFLEHARLLRSRLDRADEAVSVLVPLAAAQPDSEAVLDELALAAEAASDFATLASTLERLLERTDVAEARIPLAARLADVCERELRDATRAIGALHAWAQSDVGAPEPHRRLRPLLQAAGRDRELLATLDALAAAESDPRAQIEATLAASALAHGQLGDSEGAWRRLVPLVPAAERHADQALVLLALETQRQDELYALLEQARRYGTLVDLLRQRVGTEPDQSTRVSLFRRMARTLQGPLDDERGAEQAWSGLLQIVEDVEALQFMRAQAMQRDDMERLGDSLRRLAALESDPGERRDLLYEYGHLLHARLGRHAQAVGVLRAVLEQLDSEFEPALDELLEACEAARDAATLAWALELALSRERDAERRVEVARRLATLCEENLREPERALAALRAWSEAAPSDAEPHARCVALLQGTARHAELLAELDAVAHKHAIEAERTAALLAGAELAFERFRDADGAWARLLPLANTGNDDAEALLSRIAFEAGKIDRLTALYESAERYDDLVSVLREQAETSEDPQQQADLYRRCARLLEDPLGDELAAAEAFREVLRYAEDFEALSFLRGQAVRLDDPEQLEDILVRLAGLTAETEQKRDLLFERALLLGDRLERRDEAAAALRSLLDLDPTFVPAIEELIAVSEAREDLPSLCFALERQLAVTRAPRERADLAARLAGLYEDALQDPGKATVALRAWASADPEDPEPLRRLRPHLEREAQWAELLAILDRLAERERSEQAQTEAVLAAAELALSRQSDAQGAWDRLSPLVLAGDERAEEAARALALKAGFERALANVYVLRAQSASPELAVGDWTAAARLFEEQLRDPEAALEANLRALALDMSDRKLLDRIDRLAVSAGAWERLWRVYNRLVQHAESQAAQLELLCRHAELLERGAKDHVAALERWLEACKLAPQRDDLLERAAVLARAGGSHAELLWIHERRYENAASDEQRARCLIEAARVADGGMQDREQAMRHVARALAMTEHLPGVGAELEELARELDRARPDLGSDDARRQLVHAHMELAQQADQRFGPVLVLRAAQLLQSELGDANAGFDALKQGATAFPNDLDLYDALERAALKIRRLDALDAHLARCGERATDPRVKRALLARRGRLLAEHLQRAAKAAEVYRELCALDPDDASAFEALLRSLQQAGRYQELLKTYAERIAATEDVDARVSLMRQMARVWEVELRNRPAAIEVWHEIKALAPDDADATAALSRLG